MLWTASLWEFAMMRACSVWAVLWAELPKAAPKRRKMFFWNVLCLSLSALPVPAAAFRLIQIPAIVMNVGLIRNPIFWGRTMPHN